MQPLYPARILPVRDQADLQAALAEADVAIVGRCGMDGVTRIAGVAVAVPTGALGSGMRAEDLRRGIAAGAVGMPFAAIGLASSAHFRSFLTSGDVTRWTFRRAEPSGPS